MVIEKKFYGTQKLKKKFKMVRLKIYGTHKQNLKKNKNILTKTNIYKIRIKELKQRESLLINEIKEYDKHNAKENIGES